MTNKRMRTRYLFSKINKIEKKKEDKVNYEINAMYFLLSFGSGSFRSSLDNPRVAIFAEIVIGIASIKIKIILIGTRNISPKTNLIVLKVSNLLVLFMKGLIVGISRVGTTLPA